MEQSFPATTAFRQQDRDFVALVDGNFASAAARSGPHLLCGAGCAQCCVGAFAIGAADTLRLQDGLMALALDDPSRAANVRQRARDSWARLAPLFPGDPSTGRLTLTDDGEPADSFEDFANDEPCPVLDPTTGTCDLYAARPHTCRAYGPPVRTSEGIGVCELCFQQASAEELVAAVMEPSPASLQTELDQLAVDGGIESGLSIVAFALSLPKSI